MSSGKYLNSKNTNGLDSKYTIGDGLHLNKLGYAQLEKAMREELQIEYSEN